MMVAQHSREVTDMNGQNTVVAIYTSHQEAEKAVTLLQSHGFDMKKLSIIGKDFHPEEQILGYYNTGDRMLTWGKRGAFWGLMLGLVFGSGVFFFPGIGMVLVGGPFVGVIVAALETAAVTGGLSAVGAALFSLGIPKNHAIKYETALKADKFLLLAHGTVEEVEKAKSIINDSASEHSEIHFCPVPTGIY
jgi:hypothetical protein